MTRQKIQLTIDEDGPTHSIEGIPEGAWTKFCEQAKLQFPKAGDDAWDIETVNVDGTGRRDLTPTKGIGEGAPAWK